MDSFNFTMPSGTFSPSAPVPDPVDPPQPPAIPPSPTASAKAMSPHRTS
jgi:hypothetical protein